MINPKKDGWYLAYDMEWDRLLYKNGRWISQMKTRHVGNMTDVMIRDDITEFVSAWMELPENPDIEQLKDKSSADQYKAEIEQWNDDYAKLKTYASSLEDTIDNMKYEDEFH